MKTTAKRIAMNTMTTQNRGNNSAKKVPSGLRPFKPGQSGNPGGRPKVAKFAEEVRKFLREKVGGKTRLRAVLEDLQKHDPEVLLQYAFGKPVLSVDLNHHETTTVVGLPEDVLKRLREYAKQL